MMAPTKTKTPQKTIEDFTLEIPTSLRAIMEQELHANNAKRMVNGKDILPVNKESMDNIMEEIYEHIEKECL